MNKSIKKFIYLMIFVMTFLGINAIGAGSAYAGGHNHHGNHNRHHHNNHNRHHGCGGCGSKCGNWGWWNGSGCNSYGYGPYGNWGMGNGYWR